MRSCSLARLVTAVALALASIAADALALEPYVWDVPPRYPIPKVPEDNPMTVEGVALGRLLFYDTRLSGNLTQSCASCHQQARAFTDGRALAIGSTGHVHPRNSMNLTNVAYDTVLAWANPMLVQLERQIPIPMFGDNPVELGLKGRDAEMLERLRDEARYRRLFAEAFPGVSDPVSVNGVVRAIASFCRTLISTHSPFDDYYYRFDDDALSESALRGNDLFFTERLECFHCHNGFNFSASTTFVGKLIDEVQFDNNGLYNIDGNGAYPANNVGIMEITGDPRDMGRFKAPTLRNVEVTAPFMHDGSMATLEEVLIDQYAHGGRLTSEGPYVGDGSTSPLKSQFVRGFTLSDQEKADVLAFLHSLTDDRFLSDPRLSDPFLPATCAADCDLDEEATVDEAAQAVEVGLGRVTLAHCLPADANGDGEITVEEMVASVKVRMEGCS